MLVRLVGYAPALLAVVGAQSMWPRWASPRVISRGLWMLLTAAVLGSLPGISVALAWLCGHALAGSRRGLDWMDVLLLGLPVLGLVGAALPLALHGGDFRTIYQADPSRGPCEPAEAGPP